MGKWRGRALELRERNGGRMCGMLYEREVVQATRSFRLCCKYHCFCHDERCKQWLQARTLELASAMLEYQRLKDQQAGSNIPWEGLPLPGHGKIKGKGSHCAQLGSQMGRWERLAMSTIVYCTLPLPQSLQRSPLLDLSVTLLPNVMTKIGIGKCE